MRGDLAHRGRHPGRVRHVKPFQLGRVRHRRVRRRDLQHRRVQPVEAARGDQPGDVGGHAATRAGFVHDHHAAALAHRVQDRLLVERRGGARIEHGAGDAFARQCLGGFGGHMHHAAEGDDQRVVALAHDVRLGERNRVAAIRDLALGVVEQLVLQEDHRIVVADRLDQQPLRVIGAGGDHHLQPGDMGEDRIQRLAVLRARAGAGAVGGADDQRRGRAAAEHVAEFGRLIHDLVQADAEEIDEHDFRHRPQPGHRGPCGRADEPALADGRVQHAFGAEPPQQPLGHAEGAAPGILLARCAGPPGHVLAQHDDPRIARHFLDATPRSAPADRICEAWSRPSQT